MIDIGLLFVTTYFEARGVSLITLCKSCTPLVKIICLQGKFVKIHKKSRMPSEAAVSFEEGQEGLLFKYYTC